MQFSQQNADFRSAVVRRQQLRVLAPSYSPSVLYGMLRPRVSALHEVHRLLEQFAQLAPKSPFGIAHHAYFSGKGQRRGHVVLGFLTHGNEVGSLPAALRLLRDLLAGNVIPAGPTSLLLGNVSAARQGTRYVEEDFNRVFTFDRPVQSLERRRALEVRPLLDQAELFLDVHQTQTPTDSAFWTFPWSQTLALWATVIGTAPRGLTRAPGRTFSTGTRCLDEYVRDRGKVGLTVELGAKGFSAAQAQNCYQSCVQLLSAYDRIDAGTATLEACAETQPSIQWFETVEVVPARDAADRLRPGLGCFTAVQKDELLSASGAPPIHASRAGHILFPKYPGPLDPPPTDLYRLAIPLEDPHARFLSVVDDDHRAG